MAGVQSQVPALRCVTVFPDGRAVMETDVTVPCVKHWPSVIVTGAKEKTEMIAFEINLPKCLYQRGRDALLLSTAQPQVGWQAGSRVGTRWKDTARVSEETKSPKEVVWTKVKTRHIYRWAKSLMWVKHSLATHIILVIITGKKADSVLLPSMGGMDWVILYWCL